MENLTLHSRRETAILRGMLRGMIKLAKRDEHERRIMERLLRRTVHIIYIALILGGTLLGGKIGWDSGIDEGMDRARLQSYDTQYQHTINRFNQS